jgi:hypothetical protein
MKERHAGLEGGSHRLNKQPGIGQPFDQEADSRAPVSEANRVQVESLDGSNGSVPLDLVLPFKVISVRHCEDCARVV